MVTDKHEMIKVIQNAAKLLILILMISGFSCTSRRVDVSRKNIIPADKLKDIIEDIYITKGLMFMPSVQLRFTPPDSSSAYDQVIEGYGYTRASFDNTIRYYYIKRPKQLIKIYDEVLARLSEMESRYSVEADKLRNKSSNLWTGSDTYIYPGDSPIDFNIKLPSPGVYTISFTLTLYPDDGSFDPSLLAYTVNSDSLLTGKRHYIKSLPYLRDGRAHDYKFYVKSTSPNGVSLSGNFFNNGSNPESSVSHFIMEDISISSRAD